MKLSCDMSFLGRAGQGAISEVHRYLRAEDCGSQTQRVPDIKFSDSQGAEPGCPISRRLSSLRIGTHLVTGFYQNTTLHHPHSPASTGVQLADCSGASEK